NVDAGRKLGADCWRFRQEIMRACREPLSLIPVRLWNVCARRKGHGRAHARQLERRPGCQNGAVTSGGDAMYQQDLEKVSKQVLIRDRYDNFIGGKWVAPVEGKYFENPSPITGKRLCQIPRSTAADIELALDAAHKAKDAWGRTSVQERSRILNKVADKI